MSIHVIAEAAAGPFAAACAVLGFTGASKIARPAGTRPAVGALGLPDSPAAIRTVGIVEVAAAITGLVLGGVAAAAVAAVYAALAIAAWRLLAHAPGTPCGCLGASSAPVTKTHVVIDVAAAIAATLAIGAGSPLAAVSGDLARNAVFVVLVGCCAWLVSLLLDALPALAAAAREDGAR